MTQKVQRKLATLLALKRAFACLAFAITFTSGMGVRANVDPDPFGLSLRAPREVVLYLHPSLRYRDFVEPLVCMLQGVLLAKVSTKEIDFPLDASLLATPTQLSVEKLLPVFYASAPNPPGMFSFLLLSNDLKGGTFHYVFSTAEGDAQTKFHIGVLSIARLDPEFMASTSQKRADTTALRAYKLILKAIARLSGYGTAEGCILAFPRSLDALDAKSKDFCPDDRGVLVAAGILRPKEDKGCALIADDQKWLDEDRRKLADTGRSRNAPRK
jgi:hypothetical protein